MGIRANEPQHAKAGFSQLVSVRLQHEILRLVLRADRQVNDPHLEFVLWSIKSWQSTRPRSQSTAFSHSRLLMNKLVHQQSEGWI